MPDNIETGIDLVGGLPGVVQYSFTAEDIDGEGTTRTESGHMRREVVLQNIVHANVTHRVNTADLETICATIKQGEIITGLTLYTPGIEPANTDYYCSKLTATLIICKDDTEWWDVSYELVGV